MLKDGQGEIPGKFDKTEISCEDQAVWRFKGQLEPKSYQLHLGETGVLSFKIIPSKEAENSWGIQ